MAVTHEEVLQIAELARLRLAPDEVDQLVAQLNGILVHVEELAALDQEPVGAVGSIAEGTAPRRSDELGPDLLRLPPAALAPAWEAGFFTVPRVAALDTVELEEPFEDKARIEAAGRPDEVGAAGGQP